MWLENVANKKVYLSKISDKVLLKKIIKGKIMENINDLYPNYDQAP